MALDQRQITFQDVEGDFSGGKVTGSLKADLRELPAYNVSVRLAGLNLASLTAGSPALARQFSGIASGEIEAEMHGSAGMRWSRHWGAAGRDHPAGIASGIRFDRVLAGRALAAVERVRFQEVSGTFACRDTTRWRCPACGFAAEMCSSARRAPLILPGMPIYICNGCRERKIKCASAPILPADAASYLLRGPLFAPRIERAETTPSE